MGSYCWEHSTAATGNSAFTADGPGTAAASWGILCSGEGSEGCMEPVAAAVSAITHS